MFTEKDLEISRNETLFDGYTVRVTDDGYRIFSVFEVGKIEIDGKTVYLYDKEGFLKNCLYGIKSINLIEASKMVILSDGSRFKGKIEDFSDAVNKE